MRSWFYDLWDDVEVQVTMLSLYLNFVGNSLFGGGS